MTADLAAVLTGPLFVVELQLLRRAAVVVAHRLRLLGRGLVQQLWRSHEGGRLRRGARSPLGDVQAAAAGGGRHRSAHHGVVGVGEKLAEL